MIQGASTSLDAPDFLSSAASTYHGLRCSSKNWHVGLLVLIWLVQTIIYPAFHSIDAEMFPRWHAGYTRTMGILVFPLMMTQLITIAWTLVTKPSILLGIAASLVLVCWVTTSAISVPLHEELSKQGREQATIDRLIATNWIRTVAWTSVAVLVVL